MKNLVNCFLIFSLFNGIYLNAQDKFTLRGTISEVSSNETVIGANVYFPELELGTSSNEYGFFSITIPKGTYKIIISSLSYNTITDTINLTTNTTKNYSLVENIEALNEVIITGNVEKLDIRK